MTSADQPAASPRVRPGMRRVGAGTLRLASSLWLLSVSALAHAADTPAHPKQGGLLERTRGRLELGLSGRSDVRSELWVLSGVLSVDHAFSGGFGIGFDWGFFVAAESPQTKASTQWAKGPGNPWLKLWNERSLSPDDDLHISAGLTVPAAWLPHDAVQRGLIHDGYAFGAAGRGLWDAWLWAPEQLTLALSAGLFHRASGLLRLGLEAAAAGSLGLSQLIVSAGTMYGQLGPSLELHGRLLTWGVRLQAVMTNRGSDPLQLSLRSYVRFERPHWQLEAAGLCNLDEPLGVLGSGLSVCGASLSLGAHP